MSRFTFFENEEQTIKPEKHVQEGIFPEKTDILNSVSTEHAKYRVEQMVITKLNNIVQSHAETKRDFLVERQTNGTSVVVRVEMLDNIINVYPESLKGAMDLMVDVDLVKNDAKVSVDPQTGKINHVINHNEIIEKWKSHKLNLEKQYDFLRAPETRLNFQKFITVAQNVIIHEKNLIEDLNSKLFFDLFFDKYLVSDNKTFEPYSRPYYSQLFDGEKVFLNYQQTINAESEHTISLAKIGELDQERYSEDLFIQMYNERYKPLLQYKFSSFDVKYQEHSVLNTSSRWIESSAVSIIEQVKNNAEIITDYKLRKIE